MEIDGSDRYLAEGCAPKVAPNRERRGSDGFAPNAGWRMVVGKIPPVAEPDAPPPFGGLNPAGTVECGRCGRVIAYDTQTSWWLDESGVPGCAPAEDGRILEHAPQWTEAALADDDDGDEKDWEPG